MVIEQIQIYFMVSFVLWSDTGKIGIIEVIYAHYDQFESIKTTYSQLCGGCFPGIDIFTVSSIITSDCVFQNHEWTRYVGCVTWVKDDNRFSLHIL